jgi:anti-anti-sigma regulatory factor
LLRITEMEADGVITLYLEGRLVSGWVDEVRSAVAKRAAVATVRLDVTELRYADAMGIQLLGALHCQGVGLSSSSPFSSALIELATRPG